MIHALLLLLSLNAGASTDTFTQTATRTSTPTRTITPTVTPTASPWGAHPFGSGESVPSSLDPDSHVAFPASRVDPLFTLPGGIPKVRPWDPDPFTVLSTSTAIFFEGYFQTVDVQNLATDPTDRSQDIWLKWGGGQAVAGNGFRVEARQSFCLGLPHAAEALSAIVTSTPQSLKIVRHPIR